MKLFDRRKFVLKNAARLGERMSTRLQKYAYAIRLSNFLKKNEKVPHFPERFAMYSHLINSLQLPEKKLQYFEFGVYKGDSITYWASKNKNASSLFYGFDSFEGLPDDWFPGMAKGHFDTGGVSPTTNDDRLKFVKGWFNQTLPGFIKKQPLHDDGHIIIHMDADVYSSTYYVLNLLYFSDYIKKDTIIIFDEVIVASIADTEFRAFWDFIEVMKIEYEVLGIAKYEMAIKIIKT